MKTIQRQEKEGIASKTTQTMTDISLLIYCHLKNYKLSYTRFNLKHVNVNIGMCV